MNVCHVINSLEVGGAENTICNIVNADEECEYTVIGLGTADALENQIRASGAEVVLCNERFKFDPRAIYRLYKAVSNRNIDILHTHLPYSQVLGRIVATQTEVDVVVSTHHTLQDRYHPVIRYLEQITASVDDATVAVSEGVKQSFSQSDQEDSNRNWHVIHNGIDVASFNQRVRNAEDIRSKCDINSGPVFLNVGRCIPAKAQSVLIDAMPTVISNLTDPHLIIAGDGELKEKLQEQVQQLGVEDYVSLVGNVTPIEPYYAAADVFVISSHQEGFPIVVLEAMAAELPVIGTKISGVSEAVVEGETGFLVTPGDKEELAETMIKTVRNDRIKLGQAGKRRAESEFSIENMIEEYRSVYRSLI